MEENKYNRGKIYKLVPRVYENDYIPYIGSTCEKLLSSRLAKHKLKYKAYVLKNKTKELFTTSFKLFEDFGVNNIDIFLIEDYPSNNKYELEARERYHIENNICINKNVPTRTRKEWREINKEELKEKSKKYREINKDELKEKSKKYREEHKDELKEIKKKYREEHKDELKEKKKKYIEDNRDKINEKSRNYYKKCLENNSEMIICECGGHYKKVNKRKHIKTKNHLIYLNNII
jgi:hypothetical protein